jgi:glycosyltransferase involved in cell wall biosynthesis
MNSKDIKVAVIFWRLGPYHHARLNAAGQRMRVAGVESCGMEGTNAWEKIEGADSFRKVTLTERHVDNRHWRRELQRKMFQALDDLKPQAVAIPGWSLVDALVALLWCLLTQTPAIVMSDSTALDAPRVSWRERIKKRVVSLCSSALVAGTRHREYVMQLGMPADRIFLGYDVVDNGYFAARAEAIRKQKAENRDRFGLPENYFLVSGRFIEVKNFPCLIEAYARYRTKCHDQRPQATDKRPWELVLLGDGPLSEELRAKREKLGVRDWVRMPGFKQYPELPNYYGLASAFVLPSISETWGLVVNEAMASGLPVLVSDRCGCAPDLVRDGTNGFTFDPYSVEEIASAMLRVWKMEDGELKRMGAESSRIIAAWGPERFVSGLELAVVKALESGPRAAKPLDRLLLRALISCGKST